MNFIAYQMMLMLVLVGIIVIPSNAQPLSAIEFKDTTGTTPTSRIGWTGTATNGHFFVKTPTQTELLKSTASGVEVSGEVKATSFSGNGAGITAGTIPLASVNGLNDSLTNKAQKNHSHPIPQVPWDSVSGKPTGLLDSIPDNSITARKIVDQSIKGTEIDSTTDMVVSGIVAKNSIGIGTTNPPRALLDIQSSLSNSISYLSIIRNNLSLASGDENRIDFSANNAFRSRIANYYQGGVGDWGLKFYTSTNNTLNSQASITCMANGNVCVGNATPTAKLNVAGDLAATGNITAASCCAASDIRFKQYITPLSQCLEKIQKLQGVSFYWRQEEFPERNFPIGEQVGLIAQDVAKVLPEIVKSDQEGFESLDYDKLTAVLVEAVKSQQSLIEKQQSEIVELNSRLAKIESILVESAK